MGLLSPDLSIYQNAPRSLVREGLMGHDSAMKAKGAAMEQRGLLAQQERQAKTFQQQQEEHNRNQEFNRTLGLLAQTNDHRTPEGQHAIVQGLGQKGFGAEAMELAQKFPKPAQKTYQSVETDQGMAPFDTETGTYGAPAQFNGQPLRKPVPAAAPKEWNPLDKERLAEDKRHNMAMEAKARFDAEKAAQKAAAEAGQTKLNEAQSKIVGAAGMAKVMLDDVANQFKDSKLGGMGGFAADVVESVPLIGGKLAPKTNEYNDKRRLTAETFLREATGAAAPAPEIKFYTNLLPEGGDSPEQAQSALNAFRGAVMAKVKGVATTLRAQGKDAQATQLETKMQSLFDSSVNIKEPAPQSQVAQPKNKAERDALPPGTRYMGPDGKVATKR